MLKIASPKKRFLLAALGYILIITSHFWLGFNPMILLLIALLYLGFGIALLGSVMLLTSPSQRDNMTHPVKQRSGKPQAEHSPVYNLLHPS